MRAWPLFLSAAVGLAASASAASDLAWVSPGSAPLPERVRSVEILRHDEPVFSAPSGTSARRGAARRGVLLPLYGTSHGPGCSGNWLLVGPTAWLCSEHARLSPKEPVIARSPAARSSSGLPLDYYFVGRDGTLGYRKLATAEQGFPDAELEPGFVVAVVQTAAKMGDPFGLTTKGLWIPMRDLGKARTPTFDGADIEGGRTDIGWVVEDEAAVHVRPGGPRKQGESYARLSRVELFENRRVAGEEWIRVGEGQWLRARQLKRVRLAEPPPEALAGERWIDVDLEQQVLTAYEGRRPVFATLVSTGRGRDKDPQATPQGTSRIWIKLTTTDMDNLEDEEANSYYAIQEVPWVMFFNKGYGIHGAFWHRSFGRVRSHGCVNLSPPDAERLYQWTSPRLPAGWSSVLPTDYDRGTLVRVR